MRCATLLTLSCSVLAMHQAAAQPVDLPPDRPAPQAEVHVDARIELLSAVQWAAGYHEMLPGITTRHQTEYYHEFTAHFGQFEDHEAAEMFGAMLSQGFGFDAPPSLMLHFSNPPELTPLAPIPERLLARSGGQEVVDGFIAAVREFAADTDFAEFFADHQPLYNKLAARTQSLMASDDDLTLLEDYYGVWQHRYSIVLAPMIHDGGFGSRVLHDDGRYDVYYLVGPTDLNDDEPSFGSREHFQHLLWHEFSHSFVNPVIDTAWDQINAHQDLFAPIEAQMAPQGYGSWRPCVNEHVVRAVTTRLAFLSAQPDAGPQAMDYELGRSFVYLPQLCDALERYESDRETYPTFASFLPELARVFERLEPVQN